MPRKNVLKRWLKSWATPSLFFGTAFLWMLILKIVFMINPLQTDAYSLSGHYTSKVQSAQGIMEYKEGESFPTLSKGDSVELSLDLSSVPDMEEPDYRNRIT